MARLVGTTIANRYFVASFLGQGGMAEVYKVWDKTRMASMAIKVLHPNLTGNVTFLNHFRREAGTLARLQHPNIVRFYSLEHEDNIDFIVMDYVEGDALREVIKSLGIISLQRTLYLMRDVCSALNYAHELGYVHCDIKPANIMINGNGSSLVSDFGIAQLAGGSSRSVSTAGTAGYSAPEQIRGAVPAITSDIYSLGILLYEMCTSRRPFTGHSIKSGGNTSDRIRWEQINLTPPSPKQYNPAISEDLEHLILKCLEKDNSRRYTSAQNLFSALEPILLRDMLYTQHEQIPDSSGSVSLPVEINSPRANPRRRAINLMLVMISGLVISLFILMINPSGTPSFSLTSAVIPYSPIPYFSPTPAWEHFNSDELGFSVKYPPGWLYEMDANDASVVFASSYEVMNTETISEDGAAVALARGMVSSLESDASSSPEDLLEEFVLETFADLKIVESQPRLRIDSLPAAAGTYLANIPDAGMNIMLDITLVLDEESFVIMLGYAPESLWRTYQPVFAQMRDTLDLDSSYQP